jgi:tetratricopeptide (TPR) repeat protein
MSSNRLLRESSIVLAGVLLLAGSTTAVAQDAQETSVQKLLERGAFEQAVQQAETERGNPESAFFAAQALVRTNDNDRGRAEYGRLRETGSPDWTAIAESGQAMVAGDLEGARAAAERATAVNDSNPFTHYQKGLIAMRQSRFRDAADAFGRAAELRHDLAYAHYYSGIAHQRLREIPKMAEHLQYFLTLAPHAPEAGAVTGILRSTRPR